MGKMQRRKGHSFERWVANELKKVFPEARRHLEYQAPEALGVDLDNTGDFRIQCKRGRKYAALSALDEVQIDPIEGGIPVLVTRADDKIALVAMPFAAFVKLLKKS